MSKEHQPSHRNRWTGEMLRNKEQVCPACHENFATDEAGNRHRVGDFGINRRCASPAEVGLNQSTNSYGSKVWRI